MNISASINGLDRVKRRLQDFQKEALAAQIRTVQDATLLIHSTAVKSIQENTDGVPVKRYRPTRNAVASPPGTPPNTDTGRLVQSIKFDFQNGGLTGRVGTNLMYGLYLEFGTRAMQARPWLSAAINEVSRDIAAMFKKSIIDVIRGIE